MEEKNYMWEVISLHVLQYEIAAHKPLENMYVSLKVVRFTLMF